MLFRQMEYFQAVVDTGSFSEAAEQCHISQSAVSQQIKALEKDLGVELLERHNRTFTLTPAGELFYRKSAVLLADAEQLQREVRHLGSGDTAKLRLGFIKGYGGSEFQDAIAEFTDRFPDVELDVMSGNHEDLYVALRSDKIDLALNDQRRAFSGNYENLELALSRCIIELSKRHPLAKLDRLEAEDLKNTTCILVAGKDQQQNEQNYYRDYVGFEGDFLFAENLQDARLLVAGGKGFFPVEGIRDDVYYDASIARIPLFQNDEPVLRNYCAFWKKDNSGFYVETFADILKAQFE